MKPSTTRRRWSPAARRGSIFQQAYLRPFGCLKRRKLTAEVLQPAPDAAGRDRHLTDLGQNGRGLLEGHQPG
jgi:hypothetical protein